MSEPSVRELVRISMERIAELQAVIAKQNHDIQQILGKVLGYPRYCDDQKNFPNTTEADGVCVGDHVALSLVDEAAERIKKLDAENESAKEVIYFCAKLKNTGYKEVARQWLQTHVGEEYFLLALEEPAKGGIA